MAEKSSIKLTAKPYLVEEMSWLEVYQADLDQLMKM